MVDVGQRPAKAFVVLDDEIGCEERAHRLEVVPVLSRVVGSIHGQKAKRRIDHERRSVTCAADPAGRRLVHRHPPRHRQGSSPRRGLRGVSRSNRARPIGPTRRRGSYGPVQASSSSEPPSAPPVCALRGTPAAAVRAPWKWVSLSPICRESRSSPLLRSAPVNRSIFDSR